MDRIQSQRQSEAVAYALGLLPPDLQEVFSSERGLLNFFFGDPLFAGLHTIATTFDGRSMRSTSHYLSTYWQALPQQARRPTVVMNGENALDPCILVHEIGHCVHEILEWEDFEIEPVTGYAKSNQYEAFAEAFCAYIIPGELVTWQGYDLAKDVMSRDWFRFFDEILHESSSWRPVWMT